MTVAVYQAGQVATLVASGLADPDMVFCTEDDIYEYINDSIITASLWTKSISTKFYTFLTGAGVAEYNLPRDVLFGDMNMSVFFDNKPLARGQFAEQKNATVGDGQPLLWMPRHNKIVLSPAPDSDYAGKELAVYCGQLADAVDKNNPDQIMPVPTEFIPFIKFWSISLGWLKRHKSSRFKTNNALAMAQLGVLKENSNQVHREAPISFVTEKELRDLGYNNIRRNEREFPT